MAAKISTITVTNTPLAVSATQLNKFMTVEEDNTISGYPHDYVIQEPLSSSPSTNQPGGKIYTFAKAGPYNASQVFIVGEVGGYISCATTTTFNLFESGV